MLERMAPVYGLKTKGELESCMEIYTWKEEGMKQIQLGQITSNLPAYLADPLIDHFDIDGISIRCHDLKLP